MFISRVILFAFKNWKIASRYGFASAVCLDLKTKQNTEIGDKEHSDSEFYYPEEQETAENKKKQKLTHFDVDPIQNLHSDLFLDHFILSHVRIVCFDGS